VYFHAQTRSPSARVTYDRQLQTRGGSCRIKTVTCMGKSSTVTFMKEPSTASALQCRRRFRPDNHNFLLTSDPYLLPLILNRQSGAGQQCCYDVHEYLMMTADQKWGGRPSRAHDFGQLPWNEANKVPSLSHYHHDVAPFFPCCVWQHEQSWWCMTYRFERRQSQNCVGYQPPGVGNYFHCMLIRRNTLNSLISPNFSYRLWRSTFLHV